MANNVTSYEGVSHEAMLPRAFQRDRCRTDVFYSYLFGLLLLVFIGISIYVVLLWNFFAFMILSGRLKQYPESTMLQLSVGEQRL
ncbi:hypothetical protein TSAR_008968, partial [Trichomalopsis sarcophagae]